MYLSMYACMHACMYIYHACISCIHIMYMMYILARSQTIETWEPWLMACHDHFVTRMRTRIQVYKIIQSAWTSRKNMNQVARVQSKPVWVIFFSTRLGCCHQLYDFRFCLLLLLLLLLLFLLLLLLLLLWLCVWVSFEMVLWKDHFEKQMPEILCNHSRKTKRT